MLNNQELTALLRQNGYKVTPQRLAVYEALANTKQHPLSLIHISEPTRP